MSGQEPEKPSEEIDKAYRLAADADEAVADIEPDDEGELGDVSDDDVHGLEEDPGE